MDTTQVLCQFATLADISEENAQRYAPLARLCIARLLARLKDGVDIDTNMEALCTAAAGMLLYQYTMACGANAGDFRLGDLSISAQNTNCDDAKALCNELLASIAPLLKHDNAFLMQVN